MRKITIILAFLLCSVSLSLTGQDPNAAFDPTARPISIMEKLLVPYKKNAIHLERLEAGNLTTAPIICWRITFAKKFDPPPQTQRPKPKNNRELQERYEEEQSYRGIDYVTILMIPADRGFRIDLALQQNVEKVAANDPGSLFYVKYGFSWRRLVSQYRNYTLYLGHDQDFHYFINSNISPALCLKQGLKLTDGADMIALLADSLNVEDRYSYSSRFAVLQLAALKDQALPYVRKAIREHTALDKLPLPHFIAISLMNTPAADRMLLEYLCDEGEEYPKAVCEAVRKLPEPRPGLKPVYLKMAELRIDLQLPQAAAKKLHFEKDLIQVLRQITRTPHTVIEYFNSVNMLFTLENPGKKTVHQHTSDQIKLFALRNGDVRGTAKFMDLNETETEREIRLSDEDRTRLIPLEKTIIEAPETELSIVTALELSFFGSNDKYLSRRYIARVRRSGRIILANLPRRDVTAAFRLLIRNSTDDNERTQLERLALEFQREGKQSLKAPVQTVRKEKKTQLKMDTPLKTHKLKTDKENPGK